MTDFIGIYDNALSPEFCQRLMQRFDESPYRQPGRTGHGVDTAKKVSEDLYLEQHPEYQADLEVIRNATRTHVLEYFKTYHFGLIAPVALKVKHPQSGQAVDLTHENFAELGAGNEEGYMRLLYRLGPIQA